ncbi:MAG: hypothetical protein JJT89_05740 [Nitriliruptoraceae bacterium]|nr:hypothetical protein [Nitriliruptoraceae bacterium]
MSHAVHYRDAAGDDHVEDVGSLDAALELVERLRNDDGAQDVRVFREVPIEVKTYYRVVVADEHQPEATSVSSSATPSAPPAPPVEADDVEVAHDDAAHVEDEAAAQDEAPPVIADAEPTEVDPAEPTEVDPAELAEVDAATDELTQPAVAEPAVDEPTPEPAPAVAVETPEPTVPVIPDEPPSGAMIISPPIQHAAPATEDEEHTARPEHRRQLFSRS